MVKSYTQLLELRPEQYSDADRKEFSATLPMPWSGPNGC